MLESLHISCPPFPPRHTELPAAAMPNERTLSILVLDITYCSFGWWRAQFQGLIMSQNRRLLASVHTIPWFSPSDVRWLLESWSSSWRSFSNCARGRTYIRGESYTVGLVKPRLISQVNLESTKRIALRWHKAETCGGGHAEPSLPCSGDGRSANCLMYHSGIGSPV